LSASRDVPSPLGALLRGLCPRCRQGRIFLRRLTMNATCPACGLAFEREPGYFVGAMYISYALAVPIVAGLTALLSWCVVPGWALHWIVLLAAVLFLPAVPLVFRASRVAWIHLDHRLDPPV
jgi:uncharacterized protein (DUF983 family)